MEEHAEDELQRLLSALSTADVLGLELLFALGPNCDVASMRGAVQVARLESLLKVVKKFEQPELMPEGMRAEDYKQIRPFKFGHLMLKNDLQRPVPRRRTRV